MSHLLYQLYEHRLHRQIRAGPMPEHVGLILDGNRRYARKRGFPDPGRAYEMGAQKLDEVLPWCNELGIPAVTFGGIVLLSAARLYRGQTTNMRTPGGGFAPLLEIRAPLERS